MDTRDVALERRVMALLGDDGTVAAEGRGGAWSRDRVCSRFTKAGGVAPAVF